MKKDASKFKTEPVQLKVEKPWGFELIFSTPKSKVTSKIEHVNAGKRSSLQYHDIKEEILTLLSGDGYLMLEDSSGNVKKVKMELRKAYHIVPFQIHRMGAGESDCEIMESSTPEEGNTVRLEDDYNRGTETPEARSKRTSSGTYMG